MGNSALHLDIVKPIEMEKHSFVNCFSDLKEKIRSLNSYIQLQKNLRVLPEHTNKYNEFLQCEEADPFYRFITPDTPKSDLVWLNGTNDHQGCFEKAFLLFDTQEAAFTYVCNSKYYSDIRIYGLKVEEERNLLWLDLVGDYTRDSNQAG